MTERQRILAGVLGCFFLSGFTGLVQEVIWIRMLGLVFGQTVFAITTVLAAFMGGLGLGSIIFGHFADRDRQPLRTYGLLEIGVGVACLLVPVVLPWVQALYLDLFQRLGLSYFGFSFTQFALVLVVLLVPATLMGGTLPILSRLFARDQATLGRRVGTLYALNTFGAVAGAALAGYGLLPLFGTRGTLWLAATLTIGIGSLAVVYAARLGSLGDAETKPPGPVAVEPPADPRVAPRIAVAAALGLGVSGAASMTYEIGWTRALALVLGSSTYAFTAMLVAFLMGIALGSALYSRLRGGRPATPGAFVLIQLGIAASAVLILPVFEWMPEAMLQAFILSVNPKFIMAVQIGLAIAVMLVPTVLVGASFPCTVGLVARRRDRVGADVGRLYSLNTAGAILGTVIAGFVLIPAIGAQSTVKTAVLLNLLAGAAVAVVAARAAGRVVWATAGSLAVVTLAAWFALPAWNASIMTSGVAVYGHLFRKTAHPGIPGAQETGSVLLYEDGLTATVSVHRLGELLFLRVNGKTDASTGRDMHTQTMSAHLPLLLHPAPKSVLVIGLASGVTVGAAAQHPVERIDVVEIEPAMLRAAQFFSAQNRGALKDPRVHVTIADGRNFLLGTRERYDVIISEPSNPWIRGLATLFSEEFYALARSRLRPGGVMLQWVQGYSFHPTDLRMVVKTYQEAFPAVSIWATHGSGDYLLLGRAAPAPFDLDRLEAAWKAIPGLREDMQRSGMASPYALLADFLLGEADASRFGAIGDTNTDDRLPLEFSAPRSLYADTAALNRRILRGFRTAEFPGLAGLHRDRLDDPDVRHDLGEALLAKDLPSEALRHFEKALARDPGHFPSLLGLGTSQQRLNLPLQAVETFERAVKLEPSNAEAHFRLSQLLATEKLFARARREGERAVELRPRDAAYRIHLARLLYETGAPEEAVRHFQVALAEAPSDPTVLIGLGMAHLGARQGPEAARVLERALVLKPADSFILHQLGRVQIALNQPARAVETLRRASTEAPYVAAIHADLGRAYLSSGDLERAASSIERALALDPAMPGLSEVLGTVYLRLAGAL